MKLTTLFAAATIALVTTGTAWAAETAPGAIKKAEMAPSTMKKAEMASGTIKKVDAAQKKITIKHGELKELEMPAMTMVFAAGDAVDLAKLKAGQKVKFMASRVNGRLTVTEVK